MKKEVETNNDLLENDATLEELNFLSKESDGSYTFFSVYPNWDKSTGYKCMTFKAQLDEITLKEGDDTVFKKLSDCIEEDLEFPTMLEAIKKGFSRCGKKLGKTISVYTGSFEEAARETRKGTITAVRIPDYL